MSGVSAVTEAEAAGSGRRPISNADVRILSFRVHSGVIPRAPAGAGASLVHQDVEETAAGEWQQQRGAAAEEC